MLFRSIASRIRIHDNINRQFDYNWYTVKKEFSNLESFYPARNQGTERRRSMLMSDLLKLYKDKLDEELTCWKDVKDEMKYFIHLFHQYKGLATDKKLMTDNDRAR